MADPEAQRNDGGEPCRECRINPGETCDICGATLKPDTGVTS